LSRERTVPIGSSSASATLWYGSSSHAKSRSASRSRPAAPRSRRPRAGTARARRAPGARASVRRLRRRHPRARAQPPGLAAPVLQQQVRADPVQPRERARARRVVRLAPLERDPEQLADQPLRRLGARPAARKRSRVAA
jgi:hypothetical protein